MGDPHAEFVAQLLTETGRLHQASTPAAEPAAAAAGAMVSALRGGGRVLACGNGGSATDAQHFAGELVGRFERERTALAAIALTADTSILTAIANDYDYARVFARQVEALGRPGDVILGISTSGASANVMAAFESAKAAGMTTVAMTGRDGGAIGRAADIHINVATASTARAQEVHRTLLHAICALIERELYA
jgi:D-sedoheptulose 7-phosphate isomerase